MASWIAECNGRASCVKCSLCGHEDLQILAAAEGMSCPECGAEMEAGIRETELRVARQPRQPLAEVLKNMLRKFHPRPKDVTKAS